MHIFLVNKPLPYTLMSNSNRHTYLLGIVLALVVFAVYLPSLSNDFVNWDDGSYIYNNPMVKEFSVQSIKEAFTSYDPELYVPLTFLSYQLEHALFGLNPLFFHLTSLLIHVANVLLVFGLSFLLIKRKSVAFFIALLWGLHPVNVEAVAWVSASKDLLSTFFFLTSLLGYMISKERSSRKAYWLSVFLFVCALMSKVNVVFLPLVLLFVDSYRKERITLRSITEKWPYFLLALIFGIIALFGKTENIIALSFVETLLLSAKSTFFMLGKILIPIKLSAFYHYAEEISILSPDFFVPVLTLLAVVVALFFSRKRTKEIIFGSIFALLFFVPSFATFQKSGELLFAADRYVYLSSIGIIYIVVWMLFKIFNKIRIQKASTVVFLMVAMVFSFLTVRQTGAWKDTKSLYLYAAESYPESFFPQHNLGWLELADENYDEAIKYLKKAIEIDPNRAQAHANLAEAYGEKGMYEEGLKHALKALELDPEKREEYEGALRLLER